MNKESKGKGAWLDKFYRKLETVLVEVDDTFAAHSKASDPEQWLDSVKDDEPENHCSCAFDIDDDRVDLPRCETPSQISSDTKLEEGDRLTDHNKEHSDCEQREATSLSLEQPVSAVVCDDGDTAFVSSFEIPTGDSNRIPVPAEIQATIVEDKVTNTRAFTSNYVTVSQDEFFIEDFDAPLDNIDLYDMAIRENPSDFDDNLLYAARDRTRQLRSFKRKVMDALTSKRRREKEYEQLAIWFGDADMGCDINNNTKEHASASQDSKRSNSNAPVASEDSEWELL